LFDKKIALLRLLFENFKPVVANFQFVEIIIFMNSTLVQRSCDASNRVGCCDRRQRKSRHRHRLKRIRHQKMKMMIRRKRMTRNPRPRRRSVTFYCIKLQNRVRSQSFC